MLLMLSIANKPFMLSFMMLNVVMLSAIMLCVVMLSVALSIFTTFFVQTCNKLERSSMSTTFILEQTLIGRMEHNLAEALMELHPRAKVLNVHVKIRLGWSEKYSS